MRNLFPFFFRFGVSFDYRIPEEIILNLCNYFSKEFSTEINKTVNDFDCIAVKDKETTTYTSILLSKFNRRLEEYNINDYSNSIFFLDLTGVPSDKFTDVLLSKILENETLHPYKYILFLDSLDEKSTTQTILFKIRCLNHNILNKCFIFDKNGQYIDSNLEIKIYDTLPKLIKHLSTSTLVEKLEFKIVRKINHFKRENDGAWSACQRFFYDGVNCQKEVFNLFKEELLRIADERKIKPQYIIHDSSFSKWLSDAIVAVSNSIHSLNHNSFQNYKCDIDLQDKDNLKNQENYTEDGKIDIIFMSDLINTGSTFKKRMRKIYQKFPNASIHCISALVTNKAFDEFEGIDIKTTKQITIDDIKIDFFISVEQIYYNDRSGEKADSCPMCKHKLLPPKDVSIDISERLSSYEMWSMCEEVGYHIEDYQPRDRKNKLVPRSLELFKKNGTLLSIKFEKRLESCIGKSAEIVILFPDETSDNIEGIDSSKIETTPSGYFAKRLNLYKENYTYIPIPRKLIREVENGISLEKINNEQYNKILSQIKNIDIDTPIVVIDEVNYTGTTFKNIAYILRTLGKYPSSYFPVFDFDAKGTDSLSKDELFKNTSFLNLYEFDYA
jgi:orotate phosphoribosyltransferase-like protein